MTYKAKDGTEWEGLHPNEDGIGVCDKCGSTKIKMVSHIDGRDFYGYTYQCECGAFITMTAKRKGHMMW